MTGILCYVTHDDVNAYWKAWRNYILQIMEIYIPNGEVKAKRNLPWIDKSIINAIESETPFSAFPNVLAKHQILLNPNHQTKLSCANSLGKQMCFFSQHLNNADAKIFWNTVRLLNGNYSSIPTLQDGDGSATVESSSAKADCLNNFYTCFNHL